MQLRIFVAQHLEHFRDPATFHIASPSKDYLVGAANRLPEVLAVIGANRIFGGA